MIYRGVVGKDGLNLQFLCVLSFYLWP